jgi:NifU-like protein involved in Fe-S cluster formation
MSSTGGGALYTPDLLALAVSLSQWPLDDELALRGEARSRSCGSTVLFGTQASDDGRIGKVGLRVTACAVGQAAAAIFAAAAPGRSGDEIAEAGDSLEFWLAGEAVRPDWPGLEALERARAYPGRHGAIVLPWKAARAALCKADAER